MIINALTLVLTVLMLMALTLAAWKLTEAVRHLSFTNGEEWMFQRIMRTLLGVLSLSVALLLITIILWLNA